MKKIALTLALFGIFAVHAICQSTFTVTELENLALKNSDDFETFVLTREYSLYNNNKTTDCNHVLYWADQARSNGRKDQIGMTTCADNSHVVEFDTTNKDYFLKFKQAIKSKGYKFSHEEQKTVQGTTFYYKHYKKGSKQITLFSYDILGITTYCHQVLVWL
jgi:hypothetical protein